MVAETGAGNPAGDISTETFDGPTTSQTSTSIEPTRIRQHYPPLTTQFSVRDVCRYIFSSDKQSVFPDGVTVTYSTTDRYDPNFSSCQPSGWDVSYFQFSPAVCPSGWTYNSIRTDDPGVTSAYCCASGFWYYSELTDCGSMATYGSGTTAETRTTTDKYGQVHIETAKTLYLHRAWQIAWEASDTAQLAVSLPDLAPGSTIATWEPSATTTSRSDFDGGNQNNISYGSDRRSSILSIPFIVILVVVPTLILVSCATCFIKHRVDKKRTAQQASEHVAMSRLASGAQEPGAEPAEEQQGPRQRVVKQLPRYF